MPLFDVRSALQGPSMNPEAKRRKQLKRQIAQFSVNPYSVSDDPRAYYSQLKALATQEGIPMSMPKALERNLLGVGAYDAADTALFGALPNQEYLNESERMAGGAGSALGMIPAFFTGSAALKGLGKLAPGLKKLIPGFKSGADKADDIAAAAARKFPKKGAGIQKTVDQLKKEAAEEGFDLANFGKSANVKEKAFFDKFMNDNVTTSNKGSFLNKVLKNMKKDPDLGYNQSGASGFSKIFSKATGAGKGSFVPYDKAPKGFKTGLVNFKPGAEGTEMLSYALKNGPPELRAKLAAALANGESAVVKNIIQNLYKYRIWAKKGGKETLDQVWKKMPKGDQDAFLQIADELTDDIMQGRINLMDIAAANMGLGSVGAKVNPLASANRGILDDLMAGRTPVEGAVGRALPAGIPRQGPPGGRAADFMENFGQTPQ